MDRKTMALVQMPQDTLQYSGSHVGNTLELKHKREDSPREPLPIDGSESESELDESFHLNANHSTTIAIDGRADLKQTIAIHSSYNCNNIER